MKFSYDKSECLAYIDAMGCLRIRDAGRDGEVRGAICITSQGEMKNGYKWQPEEGQTRFFKGDSVLITF